MTLDPVPFERAGAIYPQPVALSCGRVCRARTPQERIDAILKCAEVLTRYTCALAICSFAAREDVRVAIPPVFAQFEGNLSFGHFLSIVQAVAQCDCRHPLFASLSSAFRIRKGGEPGPADAALRHLLELRNSLGHDLMALSEPKAVAVFADEQPHSRLLQALAALDGMLSLPLFLVEEQRLVQRRIVARRLLLMGESADPVPEELALGDALMHDRHLYLGVKGGAIDLHPFLIWDVAMARATYGIFFVHSVAERRLRFVTVNDDEYDDGLYREMMAILGGEIVPVEAVTLADGTDLRAEWLTRKKAIEQSRQDATGAIPWDDFDSATLHWYAYHLHGVSGDDAGIRRVICDRLLDGREQLAPDENRQLVLLFGREHVVRRTLRRDMIDCRARAGADRRWDERVESAQNVLQSLKLAIEFFGRHVGVEGATLDGLQATSGSADYVAMREALVNLFIHQDYGDPSTVSQVEITPDRTTFFNAGKSLVDAPGLVDGGRSQSRNPLISRALRLIGFAELAGSGLRELNRVWREAKRRPPIVASNAESNTFTLTLDWRALPDTSDAFWRDRLGVRLSPEEAQVLALSADPAGITVEQIASSQGILVDDAQRLANRLIKEGLAHQRGGAIHIRDDLAPLVGEAQQHPL